MQQRLFQRGLTVITLFVKEGRRVLFARRGDFLFNQSQRQWISEIFAI